MSRSERRWVELMIMAQWRRHQIDSWIRGTFLLLEKIHRLWRACGLLRSRSLSCKRIAISRTTISPGT